MVGDEDHGALLDRDRDPLRGGVCPLLPVLPRVPLSRPLDQWAEWLVRTRFEAWPEEEVDRSLAWLGRVRDTVLERARIRDGDRVLDVGTGTGLLALGALELVGEEGEVIALDVSADCLDELREQAKAAGANGRLWFLLGDAAVLPLPDSSGDVALTRSVLIYVANKAEAAREFHRVLRPGGRISLFEPINSRNLRLHEAVDFSLLGELGERVAAWEEQKYARPDDTMCNFDEDDLERAFAAAGFVELDARLGMREESAPAERALNHVGAPGRPTLLEQWRDAFEPAEVERLVRHMDGRLIPFRWTHIYLSGTKPS